MPDMHSTSVRTGRIAAVLAAASLLAACSGNLTGAATPPISQQSVNSGNGGQYAQGSMTSNGLGASPSPTPASLASSEVSIDVKPAPVALPALNGVGGTLEFLPKPAGSAGPAGSGSPNPASSGGVEASSSPAVSGGTANAAPSAMPSPAASASATASATPSAPAASPHARSAASASKTATDAASPDASASPADAVASPAAIEGGASASPSASDGASPDADRQAILAIGLRLTPSDAPSRESKTKVLATQPVVAIDLSPSEGDALLAGTHGVNVTMPENAFTSNVHVAVAVYETNSSKKKKKAPSLLAVDDKAVFRKGAVRGASTAAVRLRSGHSYEIVVFADQALILNPLATAPGAAGASGAPGMTTASASPTAGVPAVTPTP